MLSQMKVNFILFLKIIGEEADDNTSPHKNANKGWEAVGDSSNMK